MVSRTRSTFTPTSAPPPSNLEVPVPPPLSPSLSAMTTPLHSPVAAEAMLESPIAALSLHSILRDKPRGQKRTHDDWSSPSSPTILPAETRPIVPLKSTKRIKNTPSHSPLSSNPTVAPLSRDSSPAPETGAASSPVKRTRTSSVTREITNFHILPSSDDEMDDPMISPSTRCRARFHQMLGPSPLQKSFSSAGVPHKRPLVEQHIHVETVLTTPPAMLETGMKTRAKSLLSKMEKVESEHMGTEMNKVYMMVHGKGMGMGATSGGRGHRRGSALRPRQPDEPMDLD